MITAVHKAVRRSNIYRLISTITPINHSRIAKMDAWGVVVVTFLMVGILNLMRFIIGK